MTTSVLYVCALPANSELLERSWLNRAAAWRAGTRHKNPMVHMELFFPENADTLDASGLGVGIVYGGKVFVKPKMFHRSTWKFMGIPVTQLQFDRCLDWCRQREGCKFNKMGFYGGCNQANRYYCSQLVGDCLRDNGVAELTNKQCSHPNRLYDALQQETISFIGTPKLAERTLTLL